MHLHIETNKNKSILITYVNFMLCYTVFILCEIHSLYNVLVFFVAL